MAETPSRRISFTSETVEAGDGDLDEISNEDVTCEVNIHRYTKNLEFSNRVGI